MTAARLAGSAVLAMQSDERLVKLARDGHERAFAAIVSRYRAPLLRFCARILPESRTEDAVQQAFINAHAALLSGDEPAQLKPWLYTVARNASLNMLRQNGWNYEEIPLDFDGVRRPDQVVEQRIELQRTVAAVNDLPDRQRDALVMREFEGRSYEEIAQALGANDGAVRQLLNRARGALRAAASALVPPPIVNRLVASMPATDGRRVAEIFGSLGAAGVAKVGATALVAGTLVVGAVKAPLPLAGDHQPTRQKATLASPAVSKTANAANASVANSVPSSSSATHGRAGAQARTHSGHRRSSKRSRGNDSHSRSVFAPSTHQGSREQSGSGEHRASQREDGSSGSGTHTETHDSPTSEDRSGTSGEDHTTTTETGSSDGSGTSGSDDSTGLTTTGDSGSLDSSGTSSSDSSGSDSGTSGSDSVDSGTSGTSGSSDSTTGTTSLTDH